MFSKYKKQAAKPALHRRRRRSRCRSLQTGKPAVSLRRPVQRKAAEAAPMDKERKRKERLNEIKIQLHRELLENLNLAPHWSAQARLNCAPRSPTSRLRSWPKKASC